MIARKLAEKNLLTYEDRFILDNCQYETIMGSYAYGVNTEDSDKDIMGFTIPDKNMIFPHLAGEIEGFGTKGRRFNEFQQHHILDGKVEYDVKIYNIVKLFDLLLDGNPDKIDMLFVSQRCITHSTAIGNLVRENRKLFLTKKVKHTMIGYSYSQLHKANSKWAVAKDLHKLEQKYNIIPKSIQLSELHLERERRTRPDLGLNNLYNLENEDLNLYIRLLTKFDENSKRQQLVRETGVHTKFLYHVVRLLDEAEQILTTGDLNLENSKETLKSIRRNEWSIEDIEDHFQRKEKLLEELYISSTAVPYSPDEGKIKELLLNCLEIHFGSLDKAISRDNRYGSLLNDIRLIVDKYK